MEFYFQPLGFSQWLSIGELASIFFLPEVLCNRLGTEEKKKSDFLNQCTKITGICVSLQQMCCITTSKSWYLLVTLVIPRSHGRTNATSCISHAVRIFSKLHKQESSCCCCRSSVASFLLADVFLSTCCCFFSFKKQWKIQLCTLGWSSHRTDTRWCPDY